MAKQKYRKPVSVKTKAIVTLAVILVLTVGVTVLSVCGMRYGENGLYQLLPWLPTNAEQWPESIDLGLDLQGGVYVEYEATRPDDMNSTTFNSMLESTISIMQKRLTDKGYSEATATMMGSSGIRVEIPAVTDPNTVLDLIGKAAELTFRTPDGETFMTGKDVKTAYYAGRDDSATTETHLIGFELTAEGAEVFKDYTTKYINQQLGIYLDDAELMSPTVESVIPNGKGQISTRGTAEQAYNYAVQIQSGALPLTLVQQKVDTISATLGIDALQTSLTAAFIGILLVMVIMMIRYRLSGVIASWALVIYMVALFWLLAMLPGIQLTLPGIAGVVLGIGMAVDANVVIFERFNEELRKGRPIKQSIRAGFKNAFSAIADANVTTMIAGFVLLSFGTGSVRGFANTLLLGVITSFICAVVVSRVLMYNLTIVFDKKPALYIPTKKEKEAQ